MLGRKELFNWWMVESHGPSSVVTNGSINERMGRIYHPVGNEWVAYTSPAKKTHSVTEARSVTCLFRATDGPFRKQGQTKSEPTAEIEDPIQPWRFVGKSRDTVRFSSRYHRIANFLAVSCPHALPVGKHL